MSHQQEKKKEVTSLDSSLVTLTIFFSIYQMLKLIYPNDQNEADMNLFITQYTPNILLEYNKYSPHRLFVHASFIYS
jgi:hypothetical protein